MWVGSAPSPQRRPRAASVTDHAPRARAHAATRPPTAILHPSSGPGNTELLWRNGPPDSPLLCLRRADRMDFRTPAALLYPNGVNHPHFTGVHPPPLSRSSSGLLVVWLRRVRTMPANAKQGSRPHANPPLLKSGCGSLWTPFHIRGGVCLLFFYGKRHPSTSNQPMFSARSTVFSVRPTSFFDWNYLSGPLRRL